MLSSTRSEVTDVWKHGLAHSPLVLSTQPGQTGNSKSKTDDLATMRGKTSHRLDCSRSTMCSCCICYLSRRKSIRSQFTKERLPLHIVSLRGWTRTVGARDAPVNPGRYSIGRPFAATCPIVHRRSIAISVQASDWPNDPSLVAIAVRTSRRTDRNVRLPIGMQGGSLVLHPTAGLTPFSLFSGQV